MIRAHITQPYWTEETPSDAEIRDAEKRHKAAFKAEDICELIKEDDPVLVNAFLTKCPSVIGAILSQRFEARMDELVEFSVYGRVLNKVKYAEGNVA